MAFNEAAWGSSGAALLLIAVGCAGTKLHDVGDILSDGGADSGAAAGAGHDTDDDRGGSGGSQATGGSHVGGMGNGGAQTTDIPMAGSPVASGGNPYVAPQTQPPGCFDQFEINSAESMLSPGPENQALTNIKRSDDEVLNDAGQSLFFDHIQAYADFPAVSHALAADTTISLPAQLSRAPANLGQLRITRSSCQGVSAAGHTLRVKLYWRLRGAVGPQPTQGVALGTLDKKNKTTWLADTTRPHVIGEDENGRSLNTLNSVVLEHHFAESEDVDAYSIVLGLWALEEEDLPTTLYIGDVDWGSRNL